ncbi:MAG TPA: hypothetical protein RMI62_06550, partial [Polyangiaceae bacterium LLY-WYZ-15_(1-7)]|nr:hypothetical protein [Polyangiaceae bacterium LLY-WYZ-15_(1-7)]
PPPAPSTAPAEPTTGRGTGLATEPARELFRGVQVRHRPDGGLQIEADPTSAATLASLFEGMAELMRRATPPGE